MWDRNSEFIIGTNNSSSSMASHCCSCTYSSLPSSYRSASRCPSHPVTAPSELVNRDSDANTPVMEGKVKCDPHSNIHWRVPVRARCRSDARAWKTSSDRYEMLPTVILSSSVQANSLTLTVIFCVIVFSVLPSSLYGYDMIMHKVWKRVREHAERYKK